MKKFLMVLILTLIFTGSDGYSQTGRNTAEDEQAIRQIVKNTEEAWAAGDGVKFADQFTDDVDYTVWNGLYLNGREENLKGHQQIFDTIYKGTVIRAEIKKIRFLTADVATVHLQSKMYRNGQPVADVPTVVPLMVLKKENGRWRIAVFQNTPIISRGELVVGRTSENERK